MDLLLLIVGLAVAIALVVAVWLRTIRYNGLVPADRNTGLLGLLGAVVSLALAVLGFADKGVSLQVLAQLFVAVSLLVFSLPLVLRPRVR